ncbi:MAG: hypothetical protein KBT20_08505 [Bacteroidales bacterium]|nr:hypothetical protein [Candidatus Liminaster caballi]
MKKYITPFCRVVEVEPTNIMVPSSYQNKAVGVNKDKTDEWGHAPDYRSNLWESD